MGAAMFYHLTRTPAEGLVPTLIGKSQSAGWRIELRGTDADRMARLDEHLWQGDGFMAHGIAGGPHDARQPVLLTGAGGDGKTAPEAATNDPQCVIAVDGAAVEAAECDRLARVCILFDGNDEAAVTHARAQWRALTGAGVAAEYWSEGGGKWERKA